MNETLKGAIDRTILVIATMLLMKAVELGWLPANVVGELAPSLVIIAGCVIAYVVNRPKALAIAAEKAGQVVITTREIAEETPDNKNILPNDASTAEINAAVKDSKKKT